MILFKKSLRQTAGFIVGIWFLFIADPTWKSLFIGTLLILFGETIRFISAGTLKKYKGVISDNGIYAFTRNPLYIGSFIIGIGACVMSTNWIFTAVFMILFIPFYRHVILREEKFLLKNYGDIYAQYYNTVPRIFPRKLNLGYILSETSSAKSFNNKEGQTLLGIAGILFVMLVKTIL